MPIALPKMPIFELEIQSIGSICIKMVAPPLGIAKGKLSRKHRYASYRMQEYDILRMIQTQVIVFIKSERVGSDIERSENE